MSTQPADLQSLFSPKSVAVIGASETPGNRGGQAVSLLRKFGFGGDVVPVHPSGRPVFGFEGVASIADLRVVPDVALIGLGARNVPACVEEIGRAGIRAAVVWAGGFAERGVEGAQLQHALQRAADQAGVRVLGPNCLGLVNTTLAFCGTFAAWLRATDELLPGHISMVTQSGGLGAGAHAMAQAAGIGFRFMVSTGNEAGVTAVEVIELLAEDPGTHVLCCYVEGLPQGRRMLRAFERARASGKAVVVLKGGRHAATARAVAAHTGALAGEGRVWDALLDAAGAIQVYSVDELVDVAASLENSWGKAPARGRRAAILGYGGGSGVLAADQCISAGLVLPPLSGELRAELAPMVPAIASTSNPIDLTPEAANRDEYVQQLPGLLAGLDASDEIDVLLLQGGALGPGGPAVARAMCDFAGRSRKRVAVYWPSASAEIGGLFRAGGIRLFSGQPQAAAALSRLAQAGEARPPVVAAEPSRGSGQAVPDVADGDVLAEDAVHELLRGAGIATLPGSLATTPERAVAISAELGGPVALKVVSAEITHRAAAGLVRLGVRGADAVRSCFADLHAAALSQGATPNGIYVQQMGPDGTEFLVSALRDPSFGTIVSCAAGGVLTEYLDDVSFALAPMSEAQARALADRLRIAAHLTRKGRLGLADALARFLVDVSRLAAALPWESFVLEINPVVVSDSAAVALDGLAIIDRANAHVQQR